MANISKTLNVSQPRMLSGKLMMLLLILLIGCIFSRPTIAETSVYVFGSDQSTVVKTGGFAGVHETYAVTGQFQLIVDSNAGIAFFETVDANLADETGLEYGRSLNEIFNMTALAVTVIDDTTIQFEGKTADGTESDVSLKLSFSKDPAHLTGKTTPPPDSADMFFYDVNAVATKKYAGGTGEPNDPYQIATAEDLMLLGETPEDYDKHFILTADIDLDPNLPGRKVFDRAIIAPNVNDVTYSSLGEPLFDGTPFTGVFDGNGHTISHITITGGSYLGLFGQLSYPANVTNLGLKAVDVNGIGYYIGGLAGGNSGSITSSYSSGTVSGDNLVGGLVGQHSNWWGMGGRLIHCYSAATVTGTESVGGLVGHNWSTVTQCHSTGSISGDRAIGGLVGGNGRDSSAKPSGEPPDVTSCYSTGSVAGNEEVGGLVGSNGGRITTSYSAGAVTGKMYVGGFLGRNGEWSGIIHSCYSVSTVIGEANVGGIVGIGWPTSAIECYWDMETSVQTTSVGGTGLTTAEMQTANTFLDAGWDFVGETDNGTEDIWSICEGTNYPRFVWQIPVGDFVCPDGVTIDDFMFFLEHWLDVNCDASNGYCQGTDLDQSGTVDVIDLEIFFENWPDKN